MRKSSTKPRGATSYKDTAFGIIPRLQLLQLEIEGTKRGLEYIHDVVEKHIHPVVISEFIRKLHEVSFAWIFPKWGGKYRTIQVTFSGKEAPPYYQISELIINLCKDVEVRLQGLPRIDDKAFIFEVVAFLAWFQHRFVFIHPFRDYNGRTARMLTTLLLLRLKLPPIEIKANTKADRKRYITAMQNADEGNMDLLEKLIGQALTESLQNIKK